MVTHLASPIRCLAGFSGMARPIIHRICKPDKNSQVNRNVTEHHYYLKAQCFSLPFSGIPLSRFEPVNQEDRFRIKRRETNFPLTPIQMTYKFAEMPIIRKHPGWIYPRIHGSRYEDLQIFGCTVFRDTHEGLLTKSAV